MKLTEKRIRELKPAERERFEWDDELPGFGVRVQPSGATSYVLRYRIGGGRGSSQRRSSIGKPGVISLHEARSIARDHLAAVARGADPFGERQARRDAPTANALFDRFLDEHVATKSDRTQREYRRLIDRHLRPAFGTRKIADIGIDEVERLHRSMNDTPTMANRVLAVASSAFTFAERRRMRPAGSNPCRLIQRNREEERTRVFSGGELSAIGAALVQVESDGANPGAVLAIRLAALLGFRITEICSMRWENISFERGIVILPKTKTGRAEHAMPTAALAMLSDVPRIGACVVPGRNPDSPLAGC